MIVGINSIELCTGVAGARRTGIFIEFRLSTIPQREENGTRVLTSNLQGMKVFPDTVFSISKNYCTRGFLVIKLLPYFIVFQANFLHFLTSLKESHIIQLRACHSFNDSISPLTGHKIMMLLTFKGILVLMIHIGNYTLQTLLGQYFYWDSISFDWLLPIIKGYMSHLPLNKDLNTVITSTVNLESGLNKLFMPCLSTYKKWL